MTFTYSKVSLSTALAKVRRTIGDVDSDDPLLTDEEINFRLGEVNDNVRRASIACVQDILAGLARKVDRQGTGFSATRSQKFVHYQDLLERLSAEGLSLASPTMTGLLDSEREALEDDTDYQPTVFHQGMHSEDLDDGGD